MKIIAEGECWSQKWSQDGADTESVSVSIRPAVLLCRLPLLGPHYLPKDRMYIDTKSVNDTFRCQKH